jgi:hypothetical protein
VIALWHTIKQIYGKAVGAGRGSSRQKSPTTIELTALQILRLHALTRYWNTSVKGIKANAVFATRFPTIGREERWSGKKIGRCDDEREDIEGLRKQFVNQRADTGRRMRKYVTESLGYQGKEKTEIRPPERHRSRHDGEA